MWVSGTVIIDLQLTCAEAVLGDLVGELVDEKERKNTRF